VTVVLLVLLISLGNFLVGFALAVHFGHGPAWSDLAASLHLPKASSEEKPASKEKPASGSKAKPARSK
jgi:hypothetical protein